MEHAWNANGHNPRRRRPDTSCIERCLGSLLLRLHHNWRWGFLRVFSLLYANALLNILSTGGTSGCVLASRLSEDRNVSVLVLEKGLVAETWPSRVPLMSGNPTSKDFKGAVWTSIPQPFADNRSLRIVRGEVLGGGTRVNGMLYTRG